MNIGRLISNRRSNIMAIQSYVQRGARSGGLVLRQSCIAKVSGEDAPTSNLSLLQPTVAISNTYTSDQQHSMRYLKLCGIGICSASIFGISQSSNNVQQRRGYRSSTIAVSQSSNNYNELHNMQTRRGHRSSVATCEPSKLQKDNETDKRTTSNKKSDSFFDMAQQWANDYSSKRDDKDDKIMSISDAQSTKCMDRQEQQQQTPEALLEALGIIGGSSANKNANMNSNSGDIHDRNKDREEEPRNLMQKVLFKFDDFKSSLPRSSSVDKETITNTSNKDAQTKDEDDKSTLFDDFLSFANKAESLFTSRKSSKPPNIDELIEQAQSIANNTVSSSQSSNNSSSSSGFLSQVLYVQQNAQALQSTFESSFEPHLSNINVKDLFQSIPVAALHYYLEYQDSIKTPSWKRRIHRFQKNVEVNKVEELNEALLLSELSYADGVDEIRNGLHRLYTNSTNGKKMNKPQWELLFCDTESRPNQPSHFLAIQKNASSYDDTLHVLMVVRGTKNFSDLITDAMMEASDYEYNSPNDKGCDVIKGKAHSGMQLSGKYLVDRHQKLLSTLLKLSKKRKLEITLIGHSLGAGAASIAAMEWNSRDSFEEHGSDNVDVSAHVIGFGCPAVLSKELSMATKEYITTVVADADFIPRMNGATLVNLLLDVTRFDYQKQAQRDVEQALRAAKSRLALGLDEDDIQTVMGYVSSGLEKIANPMAPPSVDKSTTEDKLPATTKEEDNKVQEQLPIVLFPPGECIHFYRDGSGISGSYVPCTFFDEIDIARTCVDDHLISSGYRRIFLSLMRDFTKDDHFSFDKKKEE